MPVALSLRLLLLLFSSLPRGLLASFVWGLCLWSLRSTVLGLPPFLPGLAAPSLSAGLGRLERSGLRSPWSQPKLTQLRPGQLLLGLRMGGQSPGGALAPQSRDPKALSRGTATQENLEPG